MLSQWSDFLSIFFHPQYIIYDKEYVVEIHYFCLFFSLQYMIIQQRYIIVSFQAILLNSCVYCHNARLQILSCMLIKACMNNARFFNAYFYKFPLMYMTRRFYSVIVCTFKYMLKLLRNSQELLVIQVISKSF